MLHPTRSGDSGLPLVWDCCCEEAWRARRIASGSPRHSGRRSRRSRAAPTACRTLRTSSPYAVSGSADSLPYLADQLTVRLLAARNAEGAEERAAYAATSLTALRAYLAGLEAYRRGRVHEAEDYFNRAEGLDSGFTPADIGVATVETNYWNWRAGDEQWRADAMWRRRHRMGTADRALLTAYLGPHYPRASTEAEMIAAAAEAARVAPDRVDAWYTAGDYLWSSGPVIGYPGWEEQSAAALRRAFRLDSTRALTLEDLIVLAALAGDRKIG